MSEQLFEQQSKSRLESEDFLLEIKEAIAERLDELTTDPALEKAGLPLDLGDKVRRGEKVPPFIIIRDAIIGVGEDFRLSREEIDVLKKKFLESTE